MMEKVVIPYKSIYAHAKTADNGQQKSATAEN